MGHMQNTMIEISDRLVLAFAGQDQARLLIDAQSHSRLVFADMFKLGDSLEVIKSSATKQHIFHKLKHVTQNIQKAMEMHTGKTVVLCQASMEQSTLQETAKCRH